MDYDISLFFSTSSSLPTSSLSWMEKSRLKEKRWIANLNILALKKIKDKSPSIKFYLDEIDSLIKKYENEVVESSTMMNEASEIKEPNTKFECIERGKQNINHRVMSQFFDDGKKEIDIDEEKVIDFNEEEDKMDIDEKEVIDFNKIIVTDFNKEEEINIYEEEEKINIHNEEEEEVNINNIKNTVREDKFLLTFKIWMEGFSEKNKLREIAREGDEKVENYDIEQKEKKEWAAKTVIRAVKKVKKSLSYTYEFRHYYEGDIKIDNMVKKQEFDQEYHKMKVCYLFIYIYI